MGAVLLSPLYGAFVGDATKLIAIIAPLFAVHTTATVKTLMREWQASDASTQSVPAETVAISFLFPTAFFAALIGVLLAYSRDWMPLSFEQVQALFAIVQTVFGVYVGYIADALFSETRQDR
jgi:hypothetical protein